MPFADDFRLYLFGVLGPLAVVAAMTASAGVVNRNGVGGRAMGLAGVDSVIEEDALAAVSRNPALLATHQSPALQLSMTGAVASGSYRNQLGENYHFDGLGVFPEAAIAFPIRDSRWALGLGVTVLAAKEVDWFYRDVPGGVDGMTSYGRLEHSSRFTATRASAGFSYSFNDRFSVGASGGLVYEQFELQAPFIFQSNPILKGFKTSLDLDTDGYSGNGEAGMLFRASDRLTLGITYRSPTPLQSRGRADGTLDAQLASLGISTFDEGVHYDAEIETALPQSVATGVSWLATDRLRLSLQAEWINWSAAYDTLDITLRNGTNRDLDALAGKEVRDSVPLHWDDQFVFRGGIEFDATESLVLRAGYAFGSSPMPDNLVSPVNAAISEQLVSFGVGYKVGSYLFDFGYQYELPRTVNTGLSGFQAGEYSKSEIEIDTHWLTLGVTYDF